MVRALNSRQRCQGWWTARLLSNVFPDFRLRALSAKLPAPGRWREVAGAGVTNEQHRYSYWSCQNANEMKRLEKIARHGFCPGRHVGPEAGVSSNVPGWNSKGNVFLSAAFDRTMSPATNVANERRKKGQLERFVPMDGLIPLISRHWLHYGGSSTDLMPGGRAMNGVFS